MTKLSGFFSVILFYSALLTSSGFAQSKEPFEELAHQIFKDSISMRTVIGYGQMPKFANYLKDHFIEGGFEEGDITMIPHEETMALIVRFRGDDRLGKNPILISSHMDVVEALPEDWQRDPYTLIEEDGFFFGRGTEDTKLSVATVTATLIRLKSEGFVPGRDIILALSGDEETTMATTSLMATKYRDLIDADFAIIADGGGGLLNEDGTPQSFVVDGAEKTYATYEVTARNAGGHSSRPRKDNAIYDITKALNKLEAYDFPVMYSDLTLAFFERSAPMVGGDIGAAMKSFSENPDDLEAVTKLRDYPEFRGIIGTTCVATMLKAGHADNALPQSATATINCRIYPGVGVENTQRQLKQVIGDDTLEWVTLDSGTIESPSSPMRDDIFAAIERAVRSEHDDIPIIPHMSLGATDGSHFRAAGIPSYAFTGIYIKPSDIYSHGLNERVPLESLPSSMRFWHNLLTDLTG